MLIKYAVLDPAKNITILVKTPVEKQFRRFIASEIMKLEPAAEQLGFVSKSDDTAILDMAGGEFCGNAVRCAAMLMDAEYVLCAGQKIKCEGNAAYLPKDLKGINHTVIEIPADEHCKNKAAREEKIKAMASGCDAAGLMLLDIEKNILTPLVYVPGADTLFWENSCASGSAMVCRYLVKKYQKEISIDLNQPGGILHVEGSPDSSFIKLSGDISILCEKSCEVNAGTGVWFTV